MANGTSQGVSRFARKRSAPRKPKYYVYYGRNTSREACYTLADVNAAVAAFLKSDTPITAITNA